MADVHLVTDPTLAAFHEPRKPEETKEMVWYGAQVDPDTGDVALSLKTAPSQWDACPLIIDTKEIDDGKK